MQLQSYIIPLLPFFFSTTILAAPVLEARQSAVCSGTYGTPQCCATNVLDLADLNCNNPPTIPTSKQAFINECAAVGQQAQCCALPILGQGLLCQYVV